MSDNPTPKTFPAPRDETRVPYNRDAVSYTKYSMYETCPEQYRLHYIEGYRRVYGKGHLVFGTCLHTGLGAHFRSEVDPVVRFALEWERYKYQPLEYDRYDSWIRLKRKGETLLRKFMAEERHRITGVRAVEKPFEVQIAGIGRPIIGMIDLLAAVDDRLTIVDFKTSGQSYPYWEGELSDQLSTYYLAEPDAEQVAYCVFLKTKEPAIEWCFGRRALGDMADYLNKVNFLIQDIDQGRFYKRPGKHCSWCDYRPICLKEESRVARTLIQIEPYSKAREDEEAALPTSSSPSPSHSGAATH